MKNCSKCAKSLPLTEFYPNSRSADKLMYSCKSCQKESNKNWMSKNKDRRRKYEQEYDFLFRKRIKKAKTARHIAYGLSDEEFKEINALQENTVCAICQTYGKLQIDHDHKTGKVRGLLCMSCNVMLGNARDNKDILARGIMYLNCNYSSPNRRKV